MGADWQSRVKDLFLAVRGQRPDQRVAHLDRECGGDTELRREVESLILEHDRQSASTSGGGEDTFTKVIQDTSARSTEALIGETLGRYRILGLVGKGGMGAVYEAEDPELRRKVALKVLPAEFAADPHRLARFKREARSVAALSHPNVVTIHSVEESDDAIHFLTMELVDGEPLNRLIPEHGLDLGEILNRGAQLADGLRAAHERGIVHRDLKPANVIVDTEGRVRILDFGLAKARADELDSVDSDVDTSLALTAQGTVLGTAPYMSPEQVAGKACDHRSDIFSLGSILYEMSTGHRPFQGESFTQVMSAILQDEPTPVGELRSDLPEGLERIIERCMEKDPAKRFQTARELRDSLDGLEELQGQPRAGARRLASVWWVAIAAAIVGLVVVGFLLSRPDAGPPSVAGAPAPVAPERKMIAVLPFENLGAPEDEYFAAGMTEEITSRLAAVSGLGVISRNSADQYANTNKLTSQIGEELGVGYLLGGTIRWAPAPGGDSRLRITPRLINVADDTHLWSVSFDRPYGDIFSIQSEIASQVAAQLGVALLGPEHQAIEARPTENLEAYEAFLRGIEPAGFDCEESLKRAEDLGRAVELDPDFGQAWASLAARHSDYYVRCQSTEEVRSQARRALDRAVQIAPTSVDTISTAASYTMRVERDYDGALAWIESAGDRIGGNVQFLGQRASILRRQGHWEAAIEHYEDAFELDPRSTYLAHALAVSYSWLRDYPQALAYYDRAVSLGSTGTVEWQQKAKVFWLWSSDTEASRAVLEAIPPPVVDDGAISWAWFWQEVYDGHPATALEQLSETPREWLQTMLHRWPSALAEAHAHQFLGDVERATESYEEARGILLAEIAVAPDDDDIRRALSIANAGLGRKEEAIAGARQSVEEWPIDAHPYFGVVPLQNLALVYTMVGEHDLALDLLDRLFSMPSTTTIPMLELDPRWAPLLEEPGYAELKQKYG